jgi:hypothetical protein
LKHKLFNHLFACVIIICASSAIALSQTSSGATTQAQDAQATSAIETQNRTSADENFELNIAERRITERDFAASTTVEIGEETAHGLSLRVGVAVGADEINVFLRNVRGSVRFRATLGRVLDRLNARPTPGATP